MEWLKRYIYVENDTRYIEFPLTTRFKSSDRSLPPPEVQTDFFKKLKFHKNLSTISNNTEIYLDLDKMEYKFYSHITIK